MTDRFVVPRAGIYQFTWSGFRPGSPEDALREWTGVVPDEFLPVAPTDPVEPDEIE